MCENTSIKMQDAAGDSYTLASIKIEIAIHSDILWVNVPLSQPVGTVKMHILSLFYLFSIGDSVPFLGRVQHHLSVNLASRLSSEMLSGLKFVSQSFTPHT